MKCKNQMSPSGMEPPTCRLVGQWLNQPRHRPPRKKRAVKKKKKGTEFERRKERKRKYIFFAWKVGSEGTRCSTVRYCRSMVHSSSEVDD